MEPTKNGSDSAGGERSQRLARRRLTAVLAADVSGYAAYMDRQEEEAHRRVGAELQRFVREIERSHGRPFSTAGDGLMAEFPSAVDATRCALRLQADLARRNARLLPERRIVFRIGIHVGEAVMQDGRIGGTMVNVAARLEGLAEPGGICLSAAVFEQVRGHVHAAYTDTGERRLKNIRDPVRLYAVSAASCASWLRRPGLSREDLPRLALAPEARDYRPSLAVLPFRTLLEDRADAYFAEGIIDDVIRALGGLDDILVISRSSTIVFAKIPFDVRRIGIELDVLYLLHGSVRRAGEGLRIAVELSHVPTGQVIWADRFDGAPSDVFDFQDSIAARVATVIAPRLRQTQLDQAMRKHSGSLTAYDLTLQALDLAYRMSKDAFEQGRSLLEQACALDPGYAHAHAQLALLHTQWIGQGWSVDEAADMRRASDAAHRSLTRDPRNALGLAVFGHLRSYLLKDYAVADDYLERAIAAGPSCAWAWAYSGLNRGYMGDLPAAVARAERAARLAPLGAEAFWFEHFLAQAYYLDGRFDEAIAWGRLSAAHACGNTSNLRCLIASLVAAEQVEEASAFAQQLMRLAPATRVSSFRARTPLVGDVRDLFAARLGRAGVPD